MRDWIIMEHDDILGKNVFEMFGHQIGLNAIS